MFSAQLLNLTSDECLYQLALRRGWHPIVVNGERWYRRVEVLDAQQRRSKKRRQET